MNTKFRKRAQRGGVFVEMVLTLPVLCLLLFGIIQWGYLFGAYINVRNAAMVGARRMSLLNASADTAKAQVKLALEPLLDKDDATACPDGGGSPCVVCDSDGADLNFDGVLEPPFCTVNYSLKLFTPWVVPGSSGGRYTLSATAFMD